MRVFVQTLFVLSSLWMSVAEGALNGVPSLRGGWQLIATPSGGHKNFVEAISLAEKSVDLEMFHLTDPKVTQALIDAHQKKGGPRVRVILDGASLKSPRYQAAFDTLQKAGVDVRASSPAFSITHSKSMIIDGQTAFVTSINLTRRAFATRDLGLILKDSDLIQEMGLVFEADWRNAETKGGETPPLANAHLIFSPANAKERLVDLIQNAHQEIIITVENLGSWEIIAALKSRLQAGVAVRILLPMCDENPDPLFNYPASRDLAAAGAQIRVMPFPSTPELPYEHLKLIVSDKQDVYLGSQNFTFNSLTKARETGVIVSETSLANLVLKIYEEDWAKAVDLPAENPKNCPVLPSVFDFAI